MELQMVAELAFGSVLRYLRAHSSDPRCLATDGYYELLDDAFRSVGYLQASAFISRMYTELARKTDGPTINLGTAFI
jgi:hypothetical protein